MPKLLWSLVLICSAVVIALGVLQVAIPVIGIDAANRGANAILVVGGAGLLVGGAWTAWTIWTRSGR